MDSRVEREKSFHEKRFEDGKEAADRVDVPAALAPFMPSLSILRSSLTATYDAIKKHCQGADVLDYGCSFGETSFYCIEHGAASTAGIDISENATNTAAQEAKRLGHENAKFCAMNAEEMTFEDASFDLVCGFGIIHHLDVPSSAAELARVLKKDGRAVFLEPLGHNFFINKFRDLTPEARTEDEHPLLAADFDVFRQHFESVELQYFNLLTLPMLPLARHKIVSPMINALDAIDRQLFNAMPFFGRYAWNVVIQAHGPKH